MAINPSQRQVIKSAVERITDLETQIPSLLSQVNAGFANFGQRLNENTEIVNALTTLVDSFAGHDATSAKIQEVRIKRAEALAAEQVAGITKALADGTIVSSTTIGEKSVFVCTETDPQGEVIPPGRVQIEVQQLVPSFKSKFIGQGIGASVPTPNGNTLTVTELYDFVDPPPAAKAPAANTDEVPAAGPGPADTTMPPAPDGTAAFAAAAGASLEAVAGALAGLSVNAVQIPVPDGTTAQG
jgi:hypothetical protein